MGVLKGTNDHSSKILAKQTYNSFGQQPSTASSLPGDLTNSTEVSISGEALKSGAAGSEPSPQLTTWATFGKRLTRPSFLICVRVCVWMSLSHVWLCDMEYSPWNSPGQNTGVDSLSLLQGIFPTQGSNSDLLHCKRIPYQLSHNVKPVSKWRVIIRVKWDICKAACTFPSC